MMIWKTKKKKDNLLEEVAPPDISEPHLETEIAEHVAFPEDKLETDQLPASTTLEEEFSEVDEQETEFQLVKSEIHRQVIGSIDLSLIGTMGEGELRIEIRRAAEQILQDRAHLLNLQEQERLIEDIIDETFGLGPLEPLFRDGGITDILINGAENGLC